MIYHRFNHVILLSACLLTASRAQVPNVSAADSSQKSFIQKNVTITGDVGAYGEIYGISGSPARRPASSARLFFRPTLTLFNTFSIPFDFLLSTEGNSARQNINQYGINPSWSWGNVHLGDFTDQFTPLTFSGIFVRGAGVNVNPGLLRFSAIGGFTQRAVDGGVGTGGYSRYIYGAKIGIGKNDASYFDISFVRTRDKPSSLGPPLPNVTVVAPNGNDVWPIGDIETIRWASSGISGLVRIELSRDGGTTYQALYDSVANTGGQTWVVTGPATQQAIVKVTSLQDSVSDVSDFPFTISIGGNDQQGVSPGVPVNTFAVTPEENLVVGADGRALLLGNLLTLTGEVTGSAYSRDMRASSVDSLKFPKFFSGLFTPRIGSQADLAYSAQAAFSLPSASALVGYRRIGPGYTSLAVASLLPDQQEITFGTTFRLSQYSVGLNYEHQNDNLASQKSFTTSRNQLGGSINLPFNTEWTGTLMSNYLTMTNNASNDSARIDYSTFTLGTTHTLFFGADRFVQTASFGYTYQSSGNSTALAQSSNLASHSINLSVVMNPSSQVSLIPSLNFSDSRIDTANWNSITTYSIAAQDRALDNKLATSLSLALTSMPGTSSLMTSISSSYVFSYADVVTFSAIITALRGSEKFTERTMNLTVSHRF